MNCGFTGTRLGMSSRQLKTLRQMLYDIDKLHLGDCTGADAQAHAEAIHLGVITIGHPPDEGHHRAFCYYDEERTPLPYLERNKAIVKEGENGLIATPKDYVQPLSMRGQGTWWTIQYAKRLGRRVWIILPNGKIDK
jgi:hypothetical protein